jgi:hypothetical protein
MQNTRSARRHVVMAILRKESLWIVGIAGDSYCGATNTARLRVKWIAALFNDFVQHKLKVAR